MSRVGKKPIPIPIKVKVLLTDEGVVVQGPRGELRRIVPPELAVKVEENRIILQPREESQKVKALFGLFRTLIANMVKGVADGFERVLEIQGVGYRAEVQGNQLILNLGYSHPVPFQLPEGISAQVEKQTKLTLKRYRPGSFRTDRRPDPKVSSPRALQGQGDQVSGRKDPSEGRENRF